MNEKKVMLDILECPACQGKGGKDDVACNICSGMGRFIIVPDNFPAVMTKSRYDHISKVLSNFKKRIDSVKKKVKKKVDKKPKI